MLHRATTAVSQVLGAGRSPGRSRREGLTETVRPEATAVTSKPSCSEAWMQSTGLSRRCRAVQLMAASCNSWSATERLMWPLRRSRSPSENMMGDHSSALKTYYVRRYLCMFFENCRVESSDSNLSMMSSERCLPGQNVRPNPQRTHSVVGAYSASLRHEMARSSAVAPVWPLSAVAGRPGTYCNIP